MGTNVPCGDYVNKQQIGKYVALDLALKVFRLDYNKFKDFKAAHVYLDKLDAVIDQLTNDLYTLKINLITKHHVDIRQVDKLRYNVNGEVYTYTSDELKEMTEDMMEHYLMTVASVRTERGWM